MVIVGGGITGVATALWLRRAGRPELLPERQAATGMGTSYGNGGVLAASVNVPVTTPGLRAKGPWMLLNPNAPLFLRWPYLPRLAPWLRQYLAHANDPDTRRIAAALARITADSLTQHKALAAGTQAVRWLVAGEYAYAYPSRAAFAAEAYTWRLRAEAGFVPRVLEGPEVQAYEPALGRKTRLLAVLKDHGHIRDPGGYVQALAEALRAEGGVLRHEEVKDFELSEDGRVQAVITNRARHPCAALVLATGVWSRPLMQKLGLDIPLESERGYHLVFKNPGFTLRQPLMLAAGKFVATPMEGGPGLSSLAG